jgi:uncharacterized RDD family membrane protein YckC
VITAILLAPFASALGDAISLLPLTLLPFYYLAFEIVLGRTLGKMAMGYKIATPGGSAAPLLFRGLLRLIPVVNMIFLLSWRRVTLLDLISGTRVWNGKHVDPKNPRRLAKPSSTLRRRIGEKVPKGFDEQELER